MDDEDWQSCSLAERLVHKSWKARTSAYEEIGKKCFSFSDNEFLKYSEDLKRMVADANQVAQEAGLNTIIQFLSHAPAPLSIKCTKSTIVPLIVGKTFGSSRAGTKNMALEVLMMYVELELSDFVITEVISGLDHKTPKNVSFAIYVLKEIVRQFGVPTVNLKPILKQLVKIFDHKDVAVRNMGVELATEIYKWIGPAMSSCISNLKPIQLKELTQVFESTGYGSQKPTRFTRSNRNDSSTPTLEKSMTQETLVEGGEVEVEQFDPSSLIDPVNVLDKLPKDLYDNMTDQKWKVRKEALDSLLGILSVPKYTDGKYGELINCLGKRMNDSNIIVVTLAANCIEKLALGLNSSFYQYKSLIFSSMVDRMKEKKTQVVEAIKQALDAIFRATPDLSSFMDDFTAGFAHKNPQVRAEMVKWLTRSLGVSKQTLNKAEIKILANLLLRGMDDGADNIREASAEAMGILMKVVTEKALYPYIEKLDKIKEAKVRDYYQKASSGMNPLPKKVQPAVKVPPKISPQQTLSKPNTKKEEVKNDKIIKTTVKKVDMGISSSSKSENIKYEFTNETAFDCVLQSPLIVYSEALKDSNWKVRLEALNNFFNKMKDTTLKSEALIRFLSASPGWKESNFQILNVMISITQFLAASSDSFNAACASLVLPKKMSDLKVKKTAISALGNIVNATSFQFVLSQLKPSIVSIKNPKALCELFLWIKEALLDYGLQGLDVLALTDSLKKGLANSSQPVRAAAISAFGILNSLSKKDLISEVGDISPQIIQLLRLECDKAKECISVKANQSPDLQYKQNVVNGVNNGECEDISNSITTEIIENMNDANWKIRKAALDDLFNILKGVKVGIKANLEGNDLYAALKIRLNDSNKNLVTQAVEIIGSLAQALGQSFEKPLKILLGPTLNALTDPKPQVRQTILSSLTKIKDSVGLPIMIPVVSTTLMTDHFTLRKDLLQWLCEQEKANLSTTEYQTLIHPIFLCLQDRNADVRKLSQEIFNLMGNELGAEALQEKANDLFRGAALASIVPFLDTLKPAQSQKTGQERADTLPKASKSKPSRSRPIVDTCKTTLSKSSSSEILNVPSPNILVADMKAKEHRASCDKGILKWSFDLPRKDLNDHLSEQCSLIFSPELHSLLFSTEHYKEKDHIHGLTKLCEELQARNDQNCEIGLSPTELKLRYLSCSDLLLKYVTVRFFDTNTSILLKLLDFLELLFVTMEEESYSLSDYEASCFLPFLINKAGDSKETLRSRIRELIRGLSRLYPASKLFTYVIKGLDSKNSRTRTESLDELAYLIQRNGMSVCVAAKVFPVITLQVGDRDPGVRNAALGVIVHAYTLVGDNIYKFLGRPSEKDRSLIDEKIKRCAEVKPIDNGMDIPIKKENKRPSTPIKKVEASHNKSIELPLNVKKEFSLDLDLIEGTLNQNSSSSNLKLSILSRINQININNIHASLLIVKEIEDQLTREPESLAECVNDILNSFTNYVDSLFNSSGILSSDGARFGKHLLNAMILIFSSPSLPKFLERNVLQKCLDFALTRLLDTEITRIEQGIHLTKMMNILMVRALQNIHPNLAFSIMLEILGRSAQKMLDLSDTSLIMQSKHTELVMKCTWKLIKAIPQMLQEKALDIPPLLLDVHNFLLCTPPLEWKRRSSISIPQADMPLRTVKTILSMILNNIGNGYESLIYLIPDPANSFAVQYLRQMCDSSKKDKMLSASEIKSSLSVIFDKISNKEETKIGIQELYEFQKNHPYSADLIEERLSQTGAYFQGYIRRGLNNLKESDASVSELVKSSYDSMSVPDTSIPPLKPVITSRSDDLQNLKSKNEEASLPAMDRSLAVAELKERLAKMKLNMNK